jgi:SAM-dependent methyltransferase
VAKHTHHHGAGSDSDTWARQHAEVGDLREPELSKATKALLEAARVKPGSRVLDVACGAGHTAAAATDAGADATGMDHSPAMIRIAKERLPGTRFIEGDMQVPPDGPWNAIVCRLGAHHADPSWLSAAWTVLAPGGRLAIAERDAVDDEDRAKDMKSLDEWVLLLSNAGFDEVQVTQSEANFPGPIYIVSGSKPERAPTQLAP